MQPLMRRAGRGSAVQLRGRQLPAFLGDPHGACLEGVLPAR